MDRRTPLLVNRYEIATDAALAEASERAGVRVCMKVRMGDALNLRGSGLSREEFDYATRAHFDFVITDEPSNQPQFAVEFDGPQHRTHESQRNRDAMKDGIADRLGLRVLRIDGTFLKRHRRFTLIGFLVEVWAHERAFYKAQDDGIVPYDEPYCYFSVLEPVSTGGWTWAFSLDAPARALFVRAHQDGRLNNFVPEERGSDRQGTSEGVEEVEAYATVPLSDGNFIVGNARLKNFGVFGGIGAWELVSDLAVADAGHLLKRYFDGEIPPTTPQEFGQFDVRTKDWRRQGAPLSNYPWHLRMSGSK